MESHISRKHRPRHPPIHRLRALHDSIHQPDAQPDMLRVGYVMQQGTPEERRTEVRDVKCGLFLFDELPDCLLAELFADAVGDLLCGWGESKERHRRWMVRRGAKTHEGVVLLDRVLDGVWQPGVIVIVRPSLDVVLRARRHGVDAADRADGLDVVAVLLG